MLTMDKKAVIESEVYAKEFAKKIRKELEENKSWLINNLDEKFLGEIVRTEYEKRAEKYAGIVEKRLRDVDADIEKTLNTFHGRGYIHGNTLECSIFNHMTEVIESVVKEHLENSTKLRAIMAKRVARIIEEHIFKDEAKTKLYKAVHKKLLESLENIGESKEVLDAVEFIKEEHKKNINRELRRFADGLCDKHLEEFVAQLEEKRFYIEEELEKIYLNKLQNDKN